MRSGSTVSSVVLATTTGQTGRYRKLLLFGWHGCETAGTGTGNVIPVRDMLFMVCFLFCFLSSFRSVGLGTVIRQGRLEGFNQEHQSSSQWRSARHSVRGELRSSTTEPPHMIASHHTLAVFACLFACLHVATGASSMVRRPLGGLTKPTCNPHPLVVSGMVFGICGALAGPLKTQAAANIAGR